MLAEQEEQLCEILLRMECVHQEQINEAVELQKIRPKRLGDILMDLGYVDEDDFLTALSEQFDIPFEKKVADELDTSLSTKVPLNFIREYQMVPYKKNGSGYTVAVHNPANLLPLDDL